MSVRGTGSKRVWLAGLLLVSIFAVGFSCEKSTGKMNSPPSFDGLLQEFETRVDDLADGSIDASDVGSTTAGPANPGLLSTSTSVHSVSLSAESDFDTILAHCEHTLSPGTSETSCVASVRARFDVAVPGPTNFSISATRAPGDSAAPAGLSDSLFGFVTIDCVTDTRFASVFNPPVFPQRSSTTTQVTTEAGNPCTITIEQTASVTTSALAVPTSFIQTVSVSVATNATPDCTDGSQCPAEAPFCNSNGSCGTGDEAQPGVVAAVHCGTPFVSTSGCSYGVSGSVCRADFECADGYSCNGLGVCVGNQVCSSDLDCISPAAAFCSEQGTCSPQGQQGEGCVTGEFCRQGLICLSNRCTVRLGQGEDCSPPYTVCDGGLACFPSSETCESPLPPGSSCTDNVECADFPVLNSCNQAVGGICTIRQSSGGPCDQNLDCAGFQGCDLGTNTCI